jgi:hypothetical protein
MKKSLEMRKRKAAERVRLRAQVAEGKVRRQDVSVSAGLLENFYKAPFSVDHIRIRDDFPVSEPSVPGPETTSNEPSGVSQIKNERRRLSMRRKDKIKWANRDHTGWWIFEEVEQWMSKRQKKLSLTSRCLVRRNLRLVQAKNREEAYRKAMKFGRAGMPSKTHGGEWRFAGISMLLPIYDSMEDGSEILWEEDAVMSVSKMKKLVKSKHELSVFDDSEQKS